MSRRIQTQRGGDADRADTHCPHCALQCGMSLRREGEADVAASAFPANRGTLCRAGWTAGEGLSAPGRLTTPLMRARKGAPLEPVSWGAAIERLARDFARIAREHGPDATGVLGGGALTNEAAYQLCKFARAVLRTRRLDHDGRPGASSAAAAHRRAFGIDRGLPFPLSDLPSADVIVLVGTNPAETMPPLMHYLDEQQSRGGRLVVIDPRRTETAIRASTHLQLAPGTETALANGLLHVAVSDKLVDADFIRNRTVGFEGVKFVAGSYWPRKVEEITGVPADDIVEMAHLLGRAARVVVMMDRPDRNGRGVDDVLAYVNLTLALGQAGRLASGFGCLTHQANGQGVRELGLEPDRLPGYRSLDNARHRLEISQAWNLPLEELPAPGEPVEGVLETLGDPGGVRALFAMGFDPAAFAIEPTGLERRLRRLELLVTCEAAWSPALDHADVVLPVRGWAEAEGTITNVEGRVVRRTAARRPPDGTLTDLQVLKRLSAAIRPEVLMGDSDDAVFAELCRVTAGAPADFSGMSLARIAAEQGVFWPCPASTHPGTPRLFEQRFPTPNGRARFHPVRFDAAEEPDEDFPLYLIVERAAGAAPSSRVVPLHTGGSAALVRMHPALAELHGVAEGDAVRLRTRRGEACFTVRIDDTLRKDTVLLPSFAAAGSLEDTDPSTKLNGARMTSARLEAVVPQARGAAL